MRNKILWGLALFLIGFLIAKAQTIQPYQMSVNPNTTGSGCQLVTGQTTYCFAGDGNIYVSRNGGAYAVMVPAAGVTSLNGKTGDLKISAIAGVPQSSVSAPAVTVTVQ